MLVFWRDSIPEFAFLCERLLVWLEILDDKPTLQVGVYVCSLRLYPADADVACAPNQWCCPCKNCRLRILICRCSLFSWGVLAARPPRHFDRLDISTASTLRQAQCPKLGVLSVLSVRSSVSEVCSLSLSK